MIPEAAGFALLASLSPTALLIGAVYLGSSRPRLTAAYYLIGAIAMSLVMGLVLIAVLRAANLSQPGSHTPRYELRLGLGVVLVLLGVVLRRRQPKPAGADQARPGLLSRMVAEPAPGSAFIVGLLVFAPGASFLAAVQVIATARASVELTVAAVVTVVVINVLLVWLPIVLHYLAPERTTRYLTAFNAWLRTHGRTVTVWGLLLVGWILVGNGIYGLVTG